jgi:hypothetical protein
VTGPEDQDGVPWLTPEWCDLVEEEARALPSVPGATAMMEIVVVHDSGITTTYTTLYRDGGLAVRLGAPVEPDLRVEYEEADYRAFLRGEMQDIAKALFEGRFRLTGDLEKGVAITPVLDSEVYRRVLRRIHDRTSFP